MMAHLDVAVVTGLLLFMGTAELFAGRLLGRRTKDELVVDALSLGQFALVIKPIVVTLAAMLTLYLAPSAAQSLADLPLWQAVLVVVIPADFLHYLYHRAGHQIPFMWRMHRTHHTATAMSVTVAYRENWRWYAFMPDLWYAGAMVAAGLGEAVLISNLIFGCANLLVHSAFAWDRWLYRTRWLAPLAWILERLVQLPSTHRMHHAELDQDGRVPNQNFGQLLYLWDTAFGTAAFPRDSYPKRYGIPNDPHDPWYAQLWYPLVRSSKVGSEYN
jgi:sterol desaturase/sphingolipid hydroxylase (fatty acid hydroxylase superfamily)